MSLRDWFAGQALAGMAAGGTWGDNYDTNPVWLASISKVAYAVADAMLSARKQPPTT